MFLIFVQASKMELVLLWGQAKVFGPIDFST
jgi:hypothetical protein